MIDGEVLVVGLGSIGERHVRNLLALGQRDVTVLRREAKPPRTLSGAEFRTVTGVDEGFERHPAAVIVATPTALHTELLARAVEDGVPTLVEVPLAHTLDGLEQIAERARERGVPVLMGHNLRFHPALRAVREAVLRGDVGDVLYSQAQFGEYLPDAHTWEDYRGRYEARADLGGGVILTSIHEIDHACWLFGPVATVTCVARRRALDGDVEDTAMMVLEHESGVLSQITLDFVQRPYRRWLQVVGSEGTIEWELRGDRVRRFSAAAGEWEDALVLDDYDVGETYLDELRHFARVVRGEEEPVADLASGLHVLSVGLAARRSSDEGASVPIRLTAPDMSRGAKGGNR